MRDALRKDGLTLLCQLYSPESEAVVLAKMSLAQDDEDGREFEIASNQLTQSP